MTNKALFDRDVEMPVERLRDEIDQFDKARELADCEEFWDPDDPGQCYNCGSYAKTYDGHTYVCPNCGDEWDIWLDPMEDY